MPRTSRAARSGTLRVRVTAIGLDTTINNLVKMDSRMDGWIHDVIRDWVSKVRKKVYGRKNYPSERAGQKYVRTGALGKNWRTATKGLTAHFSNKMPYASYVVGTQTGEGQAWMHKGRWWKLQWRIAQQLPTLQRMVSQMVTQKWRGRSRA